MNQISETTFAFGHANALIGTLTMPARAPHDLAFVLPNAGVIHRIGPHRINVKLARRLARDGYASVRFDLAGLGDSARPERPHASYEVQAVDDLRAAIGMLGERTGARSCAIAGICSGAEHGLAAAVADERVAALAMIDGYAYPTAKTRWFRYGRRLQHGAAATIAGAIKRRIASFKARSDVAPSTAGSSLPPLQTYAQTLQQLVDRNVRILIVHSGSFLRRYSYASQFHDAFGAYPFAAHVRCEFAPDMDHTVTTLASQAAFLQTISEWAGEVCRPAQSVQSAQPRSRYATSPISS